MIIGFSTGVITPETLPRQMKAWKGIGCLAVEFGIDNLRNIDSVKRAIDHYGGSFEYLSVHAPGRQEKYGANEWTRSMLSALEQLFCEYPLQLLNIHPVDVDDWRVFSGYNLPLVVENMDRDKDFGGSVEDMKRVFAQVEAGMVLDVNHCYSIDPTMELAHDMLTEFSGCIREIHASGFLHVHGPLYEAHQPLIVETLKGLSYPIIIESFGSDAVMNEYEKEYRYIVDNLNA